MCREQRVRRGAPRGSSGGPGDTRESRHTPRARFHLNSSGVAQKLPAFTARYGISGFRMVLVEERRAQVYARMFRSLTLAISCALTGASMAAAEPPQPGATDFTRTNPGSIQASDIIEAMSGTRQTAIKEITPEPAGAPSKARQASRATLPAPDQRPRVLLPIYFEFGSAEPTAESRKVLEALGAALVSPELATGQFLIEGHTDAIGSATENQRLSVERARTVQAYLEQRGVEAQQLRAVGRGKEAPIASNDTDEGRQRNRRVELIRLSAN